MVNDKDKTTRIFTGSPLIVQALASRLEDRNIVPIIRDDQQNAVMFGSGSNYSGQLRIFVSEEELELANAITEEFEREMEKN